ncbi:MAG: hypothetical protein SFT91_05875 [Rickettsiaceae bacterium]|nr:hypothetical protein [Rickettsiaceae bacterium]
MYFLNIIPLISFFGHVIFFSQKTGIQRQNAVPIVTSLLILVLYFFAYIKLILLATILLYIFGLWSIYDSYKQGLKLNQLITEPLTTGIFLGIALIAGFYYQGAQFTLIEDFKIWGIASKELLTRHSIESGSTLTSISDMYAVFPRGIAMLHYFFMLPSGFFEGGALYAQFLIATSFLWPFFRNQNLYRSGIYVLALMCIGAMTASFLRSLVNEAIIGFALSSIFLIYSTEEKDENLLYKLTPIFLVIPLINQGAIILSVFWAAIISNLYLNLLKKDKLGISRDHLLSYALIFAPVMLYTLLGLIYDFLHPTQTPIHSDGSNIYNEIFGILTLLKKIIFISIKEGALLVFALIYVTHMLTKKESTKLHKEYIEWMRDILTILAGFGVYLLVIHYGKYDAIHDGVLYRSFAPIFILTASISLFFVEKTSLEHKQKIGLNLLCAFATVTLLYNIDRVSTIISLEEEELNSQIKKIEEHISKGTVVEISFENKSNNDNCYILAYNMSPFMNNEQILQCINHPISYRSYNLGKISNIPNEVEKNCKIIFKPFLLSHEVECEAPQQIGDEIAPVTLNN